MRFRSGTVPRFAAAAPLPTLHHTSRAPSVSRRKRWVAPEVKGQEGEDSHWQAMGKTPVAALLRVSRGEGSCFISLSFCM